MISAEAQGFEIDGITQEGGAGQLEINLITATLCVWQTKFLFKRLIAKPPLPPRLLLPPSWRNPLQ